MIEQSCDHIGNEHLGLGVFRSFSPVANIVTYMYMVCPRQAELISNASSISSRTACVGTKCFIMVPQHLALPDARLKLVIGTEVNAISIGDRWSVSDLQ